MQGGDSRPTGSEPFAWGPFRLIEKVGQGGFGQVYRAWDSTLQREVALKLLLPRGLNQDEEAKAVLREARLLARVRHPNVVPVYGVDRHDGRVGFWSDFVRGKTLSALLADQGPFGYREAGLIGIELGKALGAVHAAGLLHRDIKAGNAMREEGGRILLMDFGLTDEHNAAHGLGGTPAYLAPELLAGEPASVSSDIYALGVLLYHLLTGKYPVDGASFEQLKTAHETGSRRSLMDERPDLPERFVEVIETALDRDPKKRYSTAGQMRTALSGSIGISGDSASVASASQRRPRRIWLLAPALTLALVFGIPPVRNLLTPGKPAGSSVAGAHATYLKAQDLLDHYYRPSNLEAAISLFEKTLAEDPKFALAYAGLGRAYFIRYRESPAEALRSKAQTACEQALTLDRELASVHVTLGMLYTETTRNDLAAQELQQALRLDTKNAEAYGALAELHAKQGRDKDVIPNYQKAAELAPNDWRWANQLGFYYLTIGNLPAAVQQFERAVKLTPDNARAYNMLGIGFTRQNRLQDARKAYEKAIELEPTFNRISNLGTILVREGKYPEAIAMHRRSIDLNPDSYLAWGNLAIAFDWSKEKSKARDAYLKAIELAEKVREEKPKDATLISQLGFYYAHIGMAEQSIPLLRQAAALSPKDPTILNRLAQGYEVLHRRDEALRFIGKALALDFPREMVENNPELAGLRSDPRFPAQVAKVR